MFQEKVFGPKAASWTPVYWNDCNTWRKNKVLHEINVLQSHAHVSAHRSTNKRVSINTYRYANDCNTQRKQRRWILTDTHRTATAPLNPALHVLTRHLIFAGFRHGCMSDIRVQIHAPCRPELRPTYSSFTNRYSQIGPRRDARSVCNLRSAASRRYCET